MSTSDPVLFPAPIGTTEALHQDVARTRRELAETVEALAGRLDVVSAGRRQVAAGAPAAIQIAGAASAAAAAYGATHWSALGRLPRTAIAAAAAALGYLATDRILRHGQPAPAAPAGPPPAPDDHPALIPSPPGGDVVDVLIAQHRQVQHLFDRVGAAHDAADRRETFAVLVDTLHRHEKAEQEIVHPALRDLAGSGTAVVDARLHEEAAADRALAALISRGTENRYFGRDLAELRTMVEAHAAGEETDEFPLLRLHLPVEQRQRMANQVQARQAEPW